MNERAPPAYGPLVEVCRGYGISRTVAFELSGKGLLDTFKIGTRRYVNIASVNSLPQRLRVMEGMK